jgi:2-iminobutanoate/2-iminopropanoate deaminase
MSLLRRVCRQAATGLLIVLAAGCAEAERPAEPAAQPAADREQLHPGTFPAGTPFAPGVRVGDTLYVSGQSGRDPQTEQAPDGIDAQARQAMENVGQVLAAAGMDYAHLVKCHVYLADMDDYTGMNAVYASFFTGRVPARTTIEAAGLPGGSRVQIACIAYRDLANVSVITPAEGTLPRPLGPYSAAVRAGSTVYLSGMGGQMPEDRRLPEMLDDQVAQTLVNIATTLEEAGLTFADVVSRQIYLAQLTAVDAVAPHDPVFAAMPAPPTGTTVVPRLPGGIKTEMTFVAARGRLERHAIDDDTAVGAERRGLRVNGTLYTRTESAAAAGADVDGQLRAVLDRLERTLQDADMSWADVAHVQVGLADLADLGRLHQILAERWPVRPPAGTVIQMRALDGVRVQASLVAMVQS